jgi:MFS family permease
LSTNLASGVLSDRCGRKPVLVAGWLIGMPVPLLLIWAPSWGWVLATNVLLGVNQGLTWSTTIVMKIDLVGPERRGLAMGFNEAAGYLAVAVMGWATGALGSGQSAGVDDVAVLRERVREPFDGVRRRGVHSLVADRAEAAARKAYP